jgi:hypothetical protein
MDVLRSFRADPHLHLLYDRREEVQRVLVGLDQELQDALRRAETQRNPTEAPLLQTKSTLGLATTERRKEPAAKRAFSAFVG